jgi:hypothetical protein
VTEQNTMTPDKKSYHLEVTRPVWLPFNDTANELIASLVEHLGYPTTGPKADKYAVVIASLLKATQVLLRSTEARLPTYLGIQKRASAWSQFPLVGKIISKKVIDDFLVHFGGQLVEGSGTSGLHKDDNDKWQTDPTMSLYVLRLETLPAELSEARFIEVGRPNVKVNKAESRQQKKRRITQVASKPFHNNKAAKAIDEDAYTSSESRIQGLNDFWLNHPLVLPNGHAAASVTRVFHDGRLDAGGRLYGAWTGMDQKSHRLHCTIDDEPVVEIDINASQPTLLSSLLGYKLGGLGKGDEWVDVYNELSRLAMTGFPMTKQDDNIRLMDLIKHNRTVAKGVVMALIGTGSSIKPKATLELAKDLGLTHEGWIKFRDQLVATVPAFNDLEPRYDKKGQLDGYINGAGFLSYHESEMMLSTLEHLMTAGIPAYSVHDSLIVKVSDATIAAKVFRQTIHDYCKQLSGIEVLVPLSVTVADHIPTDTLPTGSDLKGIYLD